MIAAAEFSQTEKWLFPTGDQKSDYKTENITLVQHPNLDTENNYLTWIAEYFFCGAKAWSLWDWI